MEREEVSAKKEEAVTRHWITVSTAVGREISSIFYVFPTTSIVLSEGLRQYLWLLRISFIFVKEKT